MPGAALDLGAFAPTARIRPDLGLKRSILERQRAGPLEGSVSVTELLEPRPSYWRRLVHVEPTAERAARMRVGQEMHVLAGHLLAPASVREVRRRRGGIVARIDLLDDRVTELKTTTLRGGRESSGVRPAHLDQLAVYCGLLDRAEGRLVLIDPGGDAPPRVEAYDAEYPSPPAAWEEAVRRAAQLREAWTRGSPAGLPRCPWRDRGCELQAAGLCDCTGGEVASEPDAFGPAPRLTRAPGVAERLAEALAAPPPSPPIRRFRDLLYPRRAYFERTTPLEETEGAAAPPVAGRTDDLWRQLSDLLETGVAGEVAAVEPLGGEPLERVTTVAGVPLVLKTTRSWSPPGLDRLLSAQPQYLAELALRCALTGSESGSLLVGYERFSDWDQRVQSYRVDFRSMDAIRAFASERLRALHRALETGAPGDLPTCPTWMSDSCPYRPDCGCAAGAGPGVDHR